MLIGQSLAAITEGDTVVYTPAFPRQGNGITSIAECIRMPSNTTLNVQAEHVNAEDAEKTPGAGGWSSLGSAISYTAAVTTPDMKQVSATGVKELVRYKVTLSTTASVVSFAQMRILNPSWQMNGAQGL